MNFGKGMRSGILGRSVDMVFLGDNGEKELAIRNHKHFTGPDGPDIIIRPYSSGLTLAVAPIVEERGFAMLAAEQVRMRSGLRGTKVFSYMWTPASKYGVEMLKLAIRKNRNRIATGSADDVFSKSLAKGTKIWAGRLPESEATYKAAFVKRTCSLTDAATAMRDVDAILRFPHKPHAR